MSATRHSKVSVKDCVRFCGIPPGNLVSCYICSTVTSTHRHHEQLPNTDTRIPCPSRSTAILCQTGHAQYGAQRQQITIPLRFERDRAARDIRRISLPDSLGRNITCTLSPPSNSNSACKIPLAIRRMPPSGSAG